LCGVELRLGISAVIDHGVYRAAHGHSPSLPLMGAALLMAGPGVREGARLGTVSMLDLAPTAAQLLGVDLPGAERPPLVEALAPR